MLLNMEPLVPPTPPLDPELAKYADLALKGVESGDFSLLAALGVVLGVSLAKKWPWLMQRVPFLATKRGGIVLAVVISAAGMVLNAAAAGSAITLSLLKQAAINAVLGVGLYEVRKHWKEQQALQPLPKNDVEAAVKLAGIHPHDPPSP